MIMALYLRLSKEDGDMIDESNSITNQRYILRRFVEQRPEFDSYEIKEYIDDGFSGKNFERPGVQKLLEDVKSGKVHGIVVKDFSRFGRNHIEVGNYIEKIFPLLDIRFIAVNNSFDSKDYVGITPDMDVAFENLMYDYFSEENSVKIKNDLMGGDIDDLGLHIMIAQKVRQLYTIGISQLNVQHQDVVDRPVLFQPLHKQCRYMEYVNLIIPAALQPVSVQNT